MLATPTIRKHLLWEYNWDKLDFLELAIVVIERVIERGTIEEWKEILRFYGRERILDTAIKSTRLGQKDKTFTPIFLNSAFLN